MNTEIFDFWPQWSWGKFWTRLLFAKPLPISTSSDSFATGNTQTRIVPRPEAWDVGCWAPGCSQVANVGKMIINLGSPLAKCPQINNFPIFHNWFSKMNLNSRRLSAQQVTWRPSGRLKGGSGGGAARQEEESTLFLSRRGFARPQILILRL